YLLTATVASLPAVTFTATAVPGSPTTVALISGNNQSGAVGQALASPISVEARDQYGNPVPSAAVTIAVTAGGGSLGGSSATTGSDGRASLPTWTLGTTAGAQSLRVTAGTGAVDVNATATPGAPAILALVSGDNQAGDPGAALQLP